jgi:hypothetical protein
MILYTHKHRYVYISDILKHWVEALLEQRVNGFNYGLSYVLLKYRVYN